jgi:hypothetical protein
VSKVLGCTLCSNPGPAQAGFEEQAGFVELNKLQEQAGFVELNKLQEQAKLYFPKDCQYALSRPK